MNDCNRSGLFSLRCLSSCHLGGRILGQPKNTGGKCELELLETHTDHRTAASILLAGKVASVNENALFSNSANEKIY